MLHTSNHIALDFRPIDLAIYLLIQHSAYGHVLASNQVQTMRDFFAIFEVVMWSDYAFNGVLKDEICQLIAREEGTSQGSAICSDNQNFFCKCAMSFSTYLVLWTITFGGEERCF